MKKLSITLLFTLVSVFALGQCAQTLLPTTPTDFTVTQSRPKQNPHLNWNTVYNACDYLVTAKIIFKAPGGYIEQQLVGYPIVVPNNVDFPQQDIYDTNIIYVVNLYRGSNTVKYEIVSRNNIGVSTPVSSVYIRLN